MRYLYMVFSIFMGDYIIKNEVERSIELGEKIYLLQNRVILTKLYNKGAFLGFLKEHHELVKVISTVVTGISALYFMIRLVCRNNVCEKLGSAMILGGGLSNTFDRIVRTYVVDYVSFATRCKKLRSVVFNISDFFIFIGTFLFVIGKNVTGKKR